MRVKRAGQLCQSLDCRDLLDAVGRFNVEHGAREDQAVGLNVR